MELPEVEFVVFWDDGVWKVYRDGELVVPFETRDSATRAASQFAEEIVRFGGKAVVRVDG